MLVFEKASRVANVYYSNIFSLNTQDSFFVWICLLFLQHNISSNKGQQRYFLLREWIYILEAIKRYSKYIQVKMPLRCVKPVLIRNKAWKHISKLIYSFNCMTQLSLAIRLKFQMSTHIHKTSKQTKQNLKFSIAQNTNFKFLNYASEVLHNVVKASFSSHFPYTVSSSVTLSPSLCPTFMCWCFLF